MKKRTKIASLFLAMLMAFSLMAVTASAYDAGHEHDCMVCGEEGIQPRRPAAWCHSCSQAMIDDGIVWIEGNRYVAFHCGSCKATLTLPW